MEKQYFVRIERWYYPNQIILIPRRIAQLINEDEKGGTK